MDKETFVSTDWALKKLGFDEMPMKLAFESVVNLVLLNEIDLYFEKSIRGTDATVELEMQYQLDGVFLGAFIGNGYSYQHDDMKLATVLSVSHRHNTPPKFAIQQYSIDDKPFYVTDDEGIWNREKHLSADEVYFKKKQIESLSKDRVKSIDGKTKALALLAREMAENGSAKFRTGNKVNATAIKDHILLLAKEYDVPNGYLKSLDDVLNQALNELDLKGNIQSKK
jgi:hypothetical protein